MATALNVFYQNPVSQVFEAIYQRVYSTPALRRKTDCFLAAVIMTMMSIISFKAVAYSHACGVGAL